ncbi:hypothetical protein D9M68_883210 [compost metagenome]
MHQHHRRKGAIAFGPREFGPQADLVRAVTLCGFKGDSFAGLRRVGQQHAEDQLAQPQWQPAWPGVFSETARVFQIVQPCGVV